MANLARKKYENLMEELLQELHKDLKPHFLCWTKADVLKLPPKNEVIVPVSMTAIQKEVYMEILVANKTGAFDTINAEVLDSLGVTMNNLRFTLSISNLLVLCETVVEVLTVTWNNIGGLNKVKLEFQEIHHWCY
ncbi:hypothetical protein K439DRAFT_1616581 [Ramaria rubella]|nr:hypothetical protein K439DRAFT_1616581 [Ramaria rubella]